MNLKNALSKLQENRGNTSKGIACFLILFLGLANTHLAHSCPNAGAMNLEIVDAEKNKTYNITVDGYSFYACDIETPNTPMGCSIVIREGWSTIFKAKYAEKSTYKYFWRRPETNQLKRRISKLTTYTRGKLDNNGTDFKNRIDFNIQLRQETAPINVYAEVTLTREPNYGNQPIHKIKIVAQNIGDPTNVKKDFLEVYNTGSAPRSACEKNVRFEI